MNAKLMTSISHDIVSFAADMRESAISTAAALEGRESGSQIYEFNFLTRHVADTPLSLFRPLSPTYARPVGASSVKVDTFSYTFPRCASLVHQSAFHGYSNRISKFLSTSLQYSDFVGLNLVSSVICTGSSNVCYEEEVLHCTRDLRGAGPAYSFVEVHGTGRSIIGRIVAITEIEFADSSKKYLLDLALLKPAGAQVKNRYSKFVHWDVFEWEWDTEINSAKIEVFPIECLLDNVRIEACMDTCASVNSMNKSDHFVHLPRHFFERKDVICSRGPYIGIDLKDAEAARKWIKNNTAVGSMIPNFKFPKVPTVLEMEDPHL
jgi:hypothetical protein